MRASICAVQRYWILLELELQAAVYHLTQVLGTEPGSLARTVHAFNH